jgi:hypothetical protein
MRECQKLGISDLKGTTLSIDLYDVLPSHLACAATPANHVDNSASAMSEFCRHLPS